LIRKLTSIALGLVCTALLAGPPYLTDDPEPVDLHHWETYLFAAGQTVNGQRSGLAPAFEANYGPFEDAQLQFQIPRAYGDGDDGLRHRGYGDTQVGFKYRFVHESDFLLRLPYTLRSKPQQDEVRMTWGRATGGCSFRSGFRRVLGSGPLMGAGAGCVILV